jgi:hypothetical protein
LRFRSASKKLKFFWFKLIFLYHFNVLTSKIIFKNKIKINIFKNKKYLNNNYIHALKKDITKKKQVKRTQ